MYDVFEDETVYDRYTAFRLRLSFVDNLIVLHNNRRRNLLQTNEVPLQFLIYCEIENVCQILRTTSETNDFVNNTQIRISNLFGESNLIISSIETNLDTTTTTTTTTTITGHC